MRRILVTGATGFLARHLIPALQRTGSWHVTGVARAGVSPDWLKAEAYVSADLTDSDRVERIIAALAPHALVHLAAAAVGPPLHLCRTNVVAMAAVLAAIRRTAPDCRVIALGSAAEYGEVPDDALPITEDTPCAPVAAYGVSKLAATELVLDAARSWGARASVVRPFNVVGAHMPAYLVGGALVERIYEAMLSSPPTPVRVGRIDTQRDFVAVEDVVAALLRLLQRDECGSIYNFCSGQPTSIEEVLRLLLAQSGRQLTWVSDPSLVRPDDVLVSYGSNARAAATLGFAPAVPLSAALAAAWHARMRRGAT